MKYLVLSDIHGAMSPLDKLLNKLDIESFNNIIILGDVLYHGPRNDLPKTYNPKMVIASLKNYNNKIIYIKGNCDAEVDEMVLDSSFIETFFIKIKESNIYFNHGHHNSKYNHNLNLNINDILIYGHYHIFDYEKIDGINYINLGSVSIPRDNLYQYMIIDDNFIKIFNIENDKEIFSYEI